jgi:DNA-3-methyladenine glycosylase II
MAMHDRRLAPLAEQFRGVKPPRFRTVFEAFVNAVACQQLSLTVGIELLNRLTTDFGLSADSYAPQHAFPRPEDLVHVGPNHFRQLGFSYDKARSILELADQMVLGRFDASALERADNSAALEQLCGLRGVGRWTAEYVLLRGLGRIDVFPGDDVGARNRLATWLKRREELSYEAVERIVARWRPYAGLVYFHLLLAGLAESGELSHADTAQRSA